MNKSVKTALVIGSLLIALLVINPLVYGIVSGQGNWGCGTTWSGMMGPWMMTGSGRWLMMGIFWLFIVGLIVWLIIYLVQRSGSTKMIDNNGHLTALEILKSRYARGEITKEEFEDKRKDLF